MLQLTICKSKHHPTPYAFVDNFHPKETFIDICQETDTSNTPKLQTQYVGKP